MLRKSLYIVIGLCLVGVAAVVYADVSCGGTKCYGGKIKKVTYCTCPYNFGVMLEIDDKSSPKGSLKIFYDPQKSLLRARYNIWKSGPHVTGAYTPTVRYCEMASEDGCDYYDTTKGTIDDKKGISTSN